MTIDARAVGALHALPTAGLTAYPSPVEEMASREALELAARTEALFLDPTYTAKAMAGLIASVRARRFRPD